jgi:tetratricopeptide (TPR) repeat protein
MLYAQRGQSDEAIRLWLKAMQVHPEWPMPQLYLAQHLAGLGRLDESMAWIEQASALANDPVVDLFTVRLYVAFGDTEKAVELLKTLPAGHQLARYMDGLVLLLNFDFQGALDYFSAIAASEEPGQTSEFPVQVAAQIAIVTDDLDKAREFVLLDEPILREDAELRVDTFTIPAVIRLAYISQRQGDSDYARELLLAALPVVRDLPRLGWFGQGIQEVRILAMLGRKEDALAALRTLVDDGFRNPVLTDLWSLEDDPFLAVLRDDERFTAILEEVERSMEQMYDRVLEAERSGDWASLRAEARII